MTAVISPLKVARKLAEAMNLGNTALANQIENDPRLVELMWAIQWFSMQPGGVARNLTAPLLETYPERFETKRMYHKLSPHQALRDRFMAEALFRDGESYESEAATGDADVLTQDLHRLSMDSLALFEGPEYCPTLIQTLIDYMARHAQKTTGRIAATEVSRKVFDAFSYAWAERAFVQLDGESRFGKSESVAFCDGYPGRFRMVTVPPSNAETDLVRAVGRSLGIDPQPGGFCAGLRADVEFILRHGRIGLAFDEAAYLWPVRYTASTAPGRINWVRAAVKGLPCILVVTPQSYKGQMDRFVKKTGYNISQFEEQINRRIQLPSELGKDDCLSVARAHCPGLSR